MELSGDQCTELAAALHGAQGRALMELMSRLSLRQPVADVEPGVLDAARELGWITRDGALTPLGWRISDPLREFRLWEERGRQLHRWEEGPFRRETFAGRFVLELGSGFGANLLSLQPIAARVVGIELEPVYVALTPVLSELAGLDAPEVRIESAEHVDLHSGSVDVILCLGALQYMPIREVLRECARLLAPGGVAIFALSNFSSYVRALRSRWSWRPAAVARQAMLLTGMLAYPYVGRRALRALDPVYPTPKRMQSWMAQAGLRLDAQRTQALGAEMCYVATPTSR